MRDVQHVHLLLPGPVLHLNLQRNSLGLLVVLGAVGPLGPQPELDSPLFCRQTVEGSVVERIHREAVQARLLIQSVLRVGVTTILRLSDSRNTISKYFLYFYCSVLCYLTVINTVVEVFRQLKLPRLPVLRRVRNLGCDQC